MADNKSVALNIYGYKSFRDFITDAAREAFRVNPQGLTMSNLARRLGYSSHRTIAMVLKGQRLPSVDMIHRLSEYFGLSVQEQQYFELLVLEEKARDQPKQLAVIRKKIAALRDQTPITEVSMETWRQVFQWYFFVVKQLVGTRGFVANPTSIRQRLRNKLSGAEVRMALNTLEALKLIAVDSASGKWGETKTNLSVQPGIPDRYIQEHHCMMMERAKEALTEQDISNREFRGLTLRLSKDQLTAAKKEIGQFFVEFNRKFSSDDTDTVYQLNLQFFEHTK